MQPYATVADYQARFGEVDDVGMLEACLLDATLAIRAELVADGQNPDRADHEALMSVCRSMASRVMPRGADDSWGIPAGATQTTRTSGDYSMSYTLPTPYGTPRMIDSERAMLGIGRADAGFACLLGGGSHGRG